MEFLFRKNDVITAVFKNLVKAWQGGPKKVRTIIVSGLAAGGVGITVLSLSDANIITKELSQAIAPIFFVYCAVIIVAITARQEIIEEDESDQKIEAVAERVRENPKETQAAWELARVKLESYLNRNINQVRSIFWLTAFVMSVGFSLIIYGVYISYKNPNVLEPSIIAACSGVLVNFIGATFLVIYRSTMAQAKDYVTVLERINAVGMAVQILETIDDKDGQLKPKATADLAKQLLQLYTNNDKYKPKRK
ncbi:hypothetical protein KP004_12830 [Geomonas oryzisoli]|uniref:Cyanobacterial TRADD-N associated 2 transmembrane domain-containing protein n=1 Tax=Geomonas oryzisoli TaxID=2847992 RepID=A0ABX8J1Q3_9BACT|nr:hypothetical protein [Geomonas oryzisoli]QWV92105.1 hypothetical protein KP004_12830 [Geomonas oryzisoli]